MDEEIPIEQDLEGVDISSMGSFVESVGSAFNKLQKVLIENERKTAGIVEAMNSMLESSLKMGLSISL
ncbi:hypothetical protein AYI68_g4665 [Smittium mucronatum]|uniref:Uncharacterized protein n=1 Tax=Smittium mucronatum TaxID=133383 RepID=A0A1R0GWH5_9FUNG|nr:hypothetical protein AYI68_g4665 [Smittium mucronatum]